MTFKNLRILLIDDDEDDFVITRDLLGEISHRGYTVEWASRAEEGLARIAEGGFDACLLDYRLGGEDGLAVLGRIMALTPRHPAVIVVTGQGSEEIDERALAMGAADYLVKQDMDAAALDRAIRYAVGQRRALDLLAQREASLRLNTRAIDAAVNGIALCEAGPDGPRINQVNPAFTRITGYGAGDVPGLSLARLYGDDPTQPEALELACAIREKREGHAVVHSRRKDGAPFWGEVSIAPVLDEEGCITHFVCIVNDVTRQKHYEEELAYQANHDALTGLPNRNLLMDRLEQGISFAKRHGRRLAVLFLDLDQFKVVNDGIGHHVGDALLQEAARRLCRRLREGDTVARFGGDEFVVVCPELDDAADMGAITARVLEAFASPFEVLGERLRVTASVGIAFYPGDGADAATVLRNADLAMYKAKDSGRANCQFFTADLKIRMSERLRMEERLAEALERDEFELHYQPQVNATSGQISGLEALIRWRHPELGLVAPGHFIPLAEQSGLIVPIGDWVLHEACRQAASWQQTIGVEVPVGVNVSLGQLRRRDFGAVVRDALAKTGLAPSLLEIELTESMVLDNAELLLSVLRGLNELGTRTAIDDFGTGYSSLSYLQRLPVDRLKIDRAFVQDVVSNPGSSACCRAVITLAHSLGLGVVAEGVETEAQATYLGRLYCDSLQGFFFAQPLPAFEAGALLQRGASLFEPPDELQDARTLLIVDDEDSVRSALKRLLRSDGYRILTAASPDEAFPILAETEVGVIIADQRMPGMTGAEFLARVKDLHPRSMRIVLSGFTDLQTVTDSVNRGAVYKLLLKPWDNEELRTEIRQAFWRAEHERGIVAVPAARELPAVGAHITGRRGRA